MACLTRCVCVKAGIMSNILYIRNAQIYIHTWGFARSCDVCVGAAAALMYRNTHQSSSPSIFLCTPIRPYAVCKRELMYSVRFTSFKEEKEREREAGSFHARAYRRFILTAMAIFRLIFLFLLLLISPFFLFPSLALSTFAAADRLLFLLV